MGLEDVVNYLEESAASCGRALSEPGASENQKYTLGVMKGTFEIMLDYIFSDPEAIGNISGLEVIH